MLRSRTGLPCVALAIIVGVAAPAQTRELSEIFPAMVEVSRPPAEELVDRAFDNVFAPEFMMSIETVRIGRDGQRERAVFRVLRRSIDGSLRILTESLEPQSIAGTRVLQVERPDGIEQTFAYVRSLGREPFETTFRLADPFLCTWYEQADPSPSAELIGMGGRHEILARRPDVLDGEQVQRITVRPMTERGYDRIELAIAERDFAILEYRHYALPGDREASLIARADRSDMVLLDNHVLPERIRYEDRVSGDVIDVTIRHATLPRQIPNILFEPRSFHRARTDRVPKADLEQ